MRRQFHKCFPVDGRGDQHARKLPGQPTFIRRSPAQFKARDGFFDRLARLARGLPEQVRDAIHAVPHHRRRPSVQQSQAEAHPAQVLHVNDIEILCFHGLPERAHQSRLPAIRRLQWRARGQRQRAIQHPAPARQRGVKDAHADGFQAAHIGFVGRAGGQRGHGDLVAAGCQRADQVVRAHPYQVGRVGDDE